MNIIKLFNKFAILIRTLTYDKVLLKLLLFSFIMIRDFPEKKIIRHIFPKFIFFSGNTKIIFAFFLSSFVG